MKGILNLSFDLFLLLFSRIDIDDSINRKMKDVVNFISFFFIFDEMTNFYNEFKKFTQKKIPRKIQSDG